MYEAYQVRLAMESCPPRIRKYVGPQAHTGAQLRRCNNQRLDYWIRSTTWHARQCKGLHMNPAPTWVERTSLGLENLQLVRTLYGREAGREEEAEARFEKD